MAFKIVHEYEPGKFRPFERGQVSKTFTKAIQITQYADGRRDIADVDVAPHKAPITVSSVRGWTDDELASCDLHRVTAFEFPADKAPNGEPGSIPSGGAALNVLAQHGQVPPCSVTRVTSGTIAGTSMWS